MSQTSFGSQKVSETLVLLPHVSETLFWHQNSLIQHSSRPQCCSNGVGCRVPRADAARAEVDSPLVSNAARIGMCAPSPVTQFIEGGRVSQTLDRVSKTLFDST